MPNLVTLPAAPNAPNVTAAILIEGEYFVSAGEIRYSTTLPLLFDQFSGFNASARSNILNNSGTIWNEYSTGSYVLSVHNWGWVYNSGTIVAHASNGQAQAIEIGSTFAGGLVNSGSIYAVGSNFANALEWWDSGASVDNSGTIAAKAVGGAIALRARNGAEIVNGATGSILAEGGSGFSVIAIDLSRGHWNVIGFPIGGIDVANHGLIEARTATPTQPAIAIQANNNDFESMVVHNSGVIRADVAIYSSPYGSSTTLQNGRQIIINESTGTIDGMIDVTRGHDLILNQGLITGLVNMGEGSDAVFNPGTITGEVALGAGTDIYDGRGGTQNGTVRGQDGADLLYGTPGQDILDGGAGEDVLVGGGGDTLTGGAGRDIFKFVSPGTSVETITDFVSGTDVIDLRAFAPDSVTISGSTVTATTAGGSLTIQVGGAVSMSDILTGGVSSVVGTAGDDALVADADGAELNGGAGSDLLVGWSGNDRLDGGSGPDMMWGGAGDDVYIVDVSDNVDGIGDCVVEAASEGIDTVHSSASFTLGMHVENLTLTGGLSIDGGGNDLDNILIGNAMGNNLSGGGGGDTLIGGGAGDSMRGGSGHDSFRGTAAELNGDTIHDLEIGETIVITDANLENFSFSRGGQGGSTLSYSGGSLTLVGNPAARLVASAAAAGGVQLTLQASINDVRNDFNGDGRSDILWRNEAGLVTNWLGTASGAFADNYANAANLVPVEWRIAGTGDFNGDGRHDILWRHDNGLVTDWLGTATGGFSNNYANAAISVPTNWNVAAVGDFNGDGRSDILWRNEGGLIADWLGTASGGFADNYANSAVTVPVSWRVIGSGDFNGDGRDDILWRNNDGLLVDWLGNANGGFTSNYANSASGVPLDWHVAGIGDFNGDGRDDILWRSDSGSLSNWLGNANGGFTINDANAFRQVALDWQVEGIGDFNGDGRDDILWRNDIGLVADWLGTPAGGFSDNYANSAVQIPTQWQVQGMEINWV